MKIFRIGWLLMAIKKNAVEKKRPHVVGPSGQVREDVVVPQPRANDGPPR